MIDDSTPLSRGSTNASSFVDSTESIRSRTESKRKIEVVEPGILKSAEDSIPASKSCRQRRNAFKRERARTFAASLSATNRASLDREGVCANADTGCSISVTNPDVVCRLRLSSFLWPKPVRIRVANGVIATSTHYANFGSVLGHVAILDDAPETLLSVSSLCVQGMVVEFSEGNGVFIKRDSKILYR